jgi:hypothetical protein
MQGCKARTQGEVLKSFSPKSHQGNKCYGGVREEEHGWRSTNDSKNKIQWVPLT